MLLDASALSEDERPRSTGGIRRETARSSRGDAVTREARRARSFCADVGTGKELPDRIEHTRHASVAWMPDGKSFYYSRYPAAGTVPPGDEKYFSKIFLHVVGQDGKNDRLVFGDHREKTDTPIVIASEDGHWLVVRVHMGWDKSEVWIKDLTKTDPGAQAGWVPVAKDAPAIFEPIPRNDRLYIQTNDGAPHYKLYAVEYDKPERAAWKELVPESADVLDDVAILKNEIVTTYMHEASTRIERFGLDGKSRGAIALPGIGSAGVTGASDGEDLFVSFTSYVVPPQVHRVDLRGRAPGAAKLEPWEKVGSKFQASDIEVERLYAKSKDGTAVPMFVIAKKGMKRDGKNPTMLYGYGGFNVNQTPSFSARALASVNRGVVWVTAILRGGGELGEDWHKAGMLDKKQNTFDDFIACAEAVVSSKITSPDRLGIIGGSNGGLLVAAARHAAPRALSRGALARAADRHDPLSPLPHREAVGARVRRSGEGPRLRVHYAYSPYHHVREGVQYPRCSSRPRRATPASTRCMPGR